MVQVSHLYMTAGETIAFYDFFYMDVCWQMIFLLFNLLSRFVIAFLPSHKHLVISRPQSLSTVILELKKIKFFTVYTFSPSKKQRYYFANKGPSSQGYGFSSGHVCM